MSGMIFPCVYRRSLKGVVVLVFALLSFFKEGFSDFCNNINMAHVVDTVDTTPESEIVFQSPEDKVVSEVNPFLVSSSTSSSSKGSNRLAKLGFALSTNKCGLESGCASMQIDSDGDLVLSRPKVSKRQRASGAVVDGHELGLYDDNTVLIEYENSTTLDLVGLQIWRGAFLLSDFVIHFSQKYIEGKNVLELGAGTGLVGIVSSMFARQVVLTDLNEPSILDLIKANVAHNKGLVKSEVQIQPLNFMDLAWSPDLDQLVASSDVILVADVIYHVDITNAFVQTLRKVLSCGRHPKDIFIAMEKRYVFTLSDLDSVAPMYNHFLEELDSKLNLCPGAMPKPFHFDNLDTVESSTSGVNLVHEQNNITQFSVSIAVHPLDFLQYFNYDRCKELVLFHIELK